MTSFDDFKNDWKNSSNMVLSPNTLSRRTLSNLVQQMKEQFGITITKTSGSYSYQTESVSGITERLQRFLITCKEEDFLRMEACVSDKILNGHIGTKTEEYRKAVEALYEKKSLVFNYRHMAESSTDPMTTYHIYPYGIKYYNKHWYVFGRVLSPLPTDRLERFFILNSSRMSDCAVSLEGLPDSDKMTKDMKTSFESYYGVITGDAKKEILPEEVILRVYTANKKHEYYRETPLHPSQTELPSGKNADETDPDNYIRFRYRIAPTFDFIQKLLSDREDVFVEKPLELREKMKQIIQKMASRYGIL